jgi:hypothetical protein
MATTKLTRIPRELCDFQGMLTKCNDNYLPLSQEIMDDCYEYEENEYSYSTCTTLKCKSCQGVSYQICFSMDKPESQS